MVRVWDATRLLSAAEARQGELQPLLTLMGHQSRVYGAAFSPDGQRLATISADGSVKVWDVSAGSEIDPVGRELLSLGPGNDGREVAYSADGRFLAATSGSGLVRVYVTSVAELMSLAQARVTRGLTAAECRQYLQLSACPPAP